MWDGMSLHSHKCTAVLLGFASECHTQGPLLMLTDWIPHRLTHRLRVSARYMLHETRAASPCEMILLSSNYPLQRESTAPTNMVGALQAPRDEGGWPSIQQVQQIELLLIKLNKTNWTGDMEGFMKCLLWYRIKLLFYLPTACPPTWWNEMN